MSSNLSSSEIEGSLELQNESSSVVRRSRKSTSQDTPPPAYKRRRVALACTSCRSRKSRCNGRKPSCSFCVELGFECVYEQPTGSGQSKGYKPGYDERLMAVEETLQTLLQQQRCSSNGVSQHQYSTSSNLAGNSEPPTATDESTGHDDVATLNEIWPPQEDVDEEEVDGMATITDTENTSSRFYGPSSNITFLRQTSDFALAILKRAAQFQFCKEHAVRSISSPPKPPSAAASTPTARKRQINLHALPSENQALDLLRTFFSGPGIPFVYVHEEAMIRSYVSARLNHFVGVDRPWLCLLNAIFAIAIEPGIVTNKPRRRDESNSETFFERALALSREIDVRSANVDFVQSLLLMCAYCQGAHRLEQTWTLHGLAVRTALQLGLHSKAASQGLSTLESEIRKRTWLGCVLLDRTLSMTFGRPQTIPNEYVNLDLPIDCRLENLVSGEDRSAEITTYVSTTNTVCFFKSTLQLYLILGDIISQLYGANIDIEKRPEASELLPIVVALEEKLNSWKRNLPPELRKRPWDVSNTRVPNSPPTAPIFDRLSVILMLRYLNVRILLHRSVLATALQRVSSESPPMWRPDEPFVNDFEEFSINVSEKSAIEVVDIVLAASSSASLLGASWFSSYYNKAFNAALVLFNCILFRSVAWIQTKSTDRRMSLETMTSSKVVALFASLPRANEALQRLEAGTTAGARIGKAMSKLTQICKILGQSHPSCSEAIERALGPISNSHLSWPNPQQHQEGGGRPITDTITPISPSVMTHRVPDSVTQLISHFMTDSEIDLFTDLNVDAEFGLTDFIT